MLYISIIWLLTAAAILIGYFVVHNKVYAPKFITNLYIFGKLRRHKQYQLKDTILHLPKSWFFHFYLTGVICNSAVLCAALYTFCVTGKWPEVVAVVLRYTQSPSLKNTDLVSPVPILLVLVMEEIQVIRRFLECVLLNSYSSSKMSVIIYAIGVLFYAVFGTSILTLSKEEKLTSLGGAVSEITWYQALFIMLFIWASWKQYKVNKIFAKLRVNKQGQVTNTEHHIPNGDLFEFCSCPHYLMEILIYAAFCGMFAWQHEVCNCIWAFVLVNQLLAGYITHKWYKERFPKYPKNRSAIIPFIF